MSDNIELRDGQLLDLAYARALIGRMRAKYHERESDREAYNFAHLAETLYWQVVNTLEAVEEARDNAKVDAEAYTPSQLAAAREEGYRAGWAEAITALRSDDAELVEEAVHDQSCSASPRMYVSCTCVKSGAYARALADYLADQAPTTQETTP